MKAADVMVKCLENEGVKYVFGIVGKETLDFIHSLGNSTIQFIVVRHEQGAAFMADVYGRLTGTAGVCTSTLGPGAANLLTGITSAQLDHSPVVAITGQAGFERIHKASHQLIDIEKMYQPVTKWSIQIKDPKTIPEIIRKAFKTAESEKPGAVLLELPENLAAVEIEEKPLPRIPLPQSVPNSQSFDAAIKLINRSERPFILVGNGVIRQKASSELQIFAETIHAPVAHTFMAKGVLPPNHPLNMYTFGFQTKDYVVNALRKADLIIAIGFDINEKLPKDWNIDQKPVLHIDTACAEIDQYYPALLELTGNIKETLKLLTQSSQLLLKSNLNVQSLKQRVKQAHGIDEEINFSEEEKKAKPQHVMQILQKLVTENTILLSDVGANKITVARTFQPQKPNRVIISNGFASMGIALPGAIAAKLACPNDPVICITGDGGLMMNIAEIETAKRLGLSFVIIVLTDSMLGLEWQMMNEKFSSDDGVYFTNPDFVQLAKSFGITGMRVSHPSEIEHVLTEAFTHEDIVLVEIPVDNRS